MLTGDMKDTAINVGHSCGLIDKDYKVLTVDGISKKDVLHMVVQGKG